MKKIASILAVLIFLVLSGCAPTMEVEREKDAIQAMAEEFVRAINEGDAETLVALFTDDAVRMPPNEPAVTGKEALEAQYRAEFAQFDIDLNWTLEEIVVVGEWAYYRAGYTVSVTPRAGGESAREIGKILDILERGSGGSWKIARHIWNLDSPPTPQKT